MIQLTDQQKQAVTSKGGKLLVSAAAGSGKTKVLVERLLSYINDPQDPADLDQFLIITYTKAAAAELRGKIAARLTEAIADDPGNLHLQQQMQKLYMTQISTVHSFCTELLREYAYRIDISSDFRVADESECAELQSMVFQSLLEDIYKPGYGNDDLRVFLDTQGVARDDRSIPELIYQVYKNSRCHLDPDGWLRSCADFGDLDTTTDPATLKWGEYLIDDLRDLLDMYIDSFTKAAYKAQDIDGLAPAAACLLSDADRLRNLRSLQTWDEIHNGRKIPFDRFPTIKQSADPLLLENIKLLRDKMKKAINKRLEAFTDPAEQVIADLKTTGAAARGLIGLVFDFAEAYAKLKRSRRVMDFSDLEQRTLDLLVGRSRQAPTAIAADVSCRYREVMIDEYQDSNAVQDKIFSALTEKRQNCFMVGDVKQSIYQFRLADPTIFLEKYNHYVPEENAKEGEGRLVILSSNFRSGAGVLSGTNDVFRRCMSTHVGGLDYTDKEALVEGVPHCSINEPEVSFYGVMVDHDTYAEEAEFVAKRISELLDGTHMVRDKDVLRPIVADDIMILLRSPKSVGRDYVFALAERGIRCVMDGDIDLLKTDEVNELVNILRLISNPLQDIPLLASMVGKAYGFTADEIAALRAGHRKMPLYEAVCSSNTPKVKSFLSSLAKLREESRVMSVADLIDFILNETKLDSIYASMSDGAIRTANIQQFCRIVSNYESVGNRNLDQVLQYLDTMAKEGLFVAGKTDSGAISITSIHKSKGLEYPVVFLCGLSKRFNLEDSVKSVLCDKTLGLGLFCANAETRTRYPSLSKRAIAAKIIRQSISEELRVLYVAMTRAKDRLIMTYASNHLEKTLTEYVALSDLCSNKLLTSQVNSAGSWVLQTALHKTEAGELFKLGGYPEEIQVSDIPWHIEVVESVSGPDVEVEEVKREEATLPDEIISKLESSLSFTYPYAEATTIPSKQTATQLKGRNKDQEITAHAPAKRTRSKHRAPSFIKNEKTGREYGNAIHAAMQFIRYEACDSLQGVIAEVERLVREDYLSKEQGTLVDCNAIYEFFASEIGQKVRASKDPLREFKFSILVSPSNADSSISEERILLQGVVDCAIEEDDGITVIDFKSDSVTEETFDYMTEKYRPQVVAYANALSRICGKPIKATMLYFFRISRFAHIEL